MDLRHACLPHSSGGTALRVLVTGGSGFIGSHVLDVLAARGHDAVNFDRVESPHHEPGAIETIIGEATDADALAAAMGGCDAVIHLAAMADVNDVQADPEGAELANARATLAVLEAARRAEVGRVVYGSTIWVYSDVPETAVCEQTRLSHPAHLYTATKLAGELYCRSYAGALRRRVHGAAVRHPVRPAGARRHRAGRVHQEGAGRRAADGGRAAATRRAASSTSRTSPTASCAASSSAAANRIYNLTGTETTTILEIAEAVRDLVGDAEIVHTPARAGDFGGKEVSSARALEDLGWEPRTPFREGARRYVEWRRAREEQPAKEPVPAALAAAIGGARLAPAHPAGAFQGPAAGCAP